MEALDKFPHSDIDPQNYTPLQRSAQPEQHKSPLQARLPWVKVTAKDQERFHYRGKEGEEHRDHFLKIVLREPCPSHDPKQQEKEERSLQRAVDLKRNGKEIEGKIRAENSSLVQASRGVAHGYLLTGIAKPTATANSIFDHVIHLCQPSEAKEEESVKEAQEDSSSGSMMEKDLSQMEESSIYQFPLCFQQLHQSWFLKLHSYEYLKFMSRVYLFLKEQGMDETQIQGELFFNQKGLSIWLTCKEDNSEVKVSDEEYYRYFCDLLHSHASQIDSELKAAPALSSTAYQLNFSSHRMQLTSIDYLALAASLFKGIDLSQESVLSIARHEQQRHRYLLEEFIYLSREERISTLLRLLNKEGQLYNSVELVPLFQQNESSNYLVVVKGLPEEGPEGTVSLQEVLEEAVTQGNREVDREFALVKLSLLQHMVSLKQALDNDRNQVKTGAAFILSQFTLHPRHILVDKQTHCYLNFAEVIQNSLKLQTLPLSHEQKMLHMTPSESVDFYDILIKLMEDIHPPEMTLSRWNRSLEDYISDLCRSLSSDNLTFTLRTPPGGEHPCSSLSSLKEDFRALDSHLQRERVRIKTQSQMQRMSSIVELLSEDYLKFTKTCAKYITSQEIFHLLLISIMEYEIKGQERCILSAEPRTGEKSQMRELSRHSPREQKEAYQMALLMLICCGVVNDIECKELAGGAEEGSLEDYAHNLSRVKTLIEEHFLRTYQLYLRQLHQAVSRKDRYQVKPQVQSFQSMVETYFRLLSQVQGSTDRALIKAALLLHLEGTHLHLVMDVLEIPETLRRMLLVGVVEDSEEYLEGEQLVKDCLVDSYSKLTHQVVNSPSYLSLSLSPLLDQGQQQLQSQEVLRVVQGVEARRKYIEDSFRQRNIQKIIEQVGTLSTFIKNKSNTNKQSKHQLQQLSRRVLFQEETEGETLREAIQKRQKEVREELNLLFCEVYAGRSERRRHTQQRNIGEQVQKEERTTLDVLGYFLYPDCCSPGACSREQAGYYMGRFANTMISRLSVGEGVDRVPS